MCVCVCVCVRVCVCVCVCVNKAEVEWKQSSVLLSTYCNPRLKEGHVECQTEGNNKEQGQHDCSQECVEYVDKHQHIDPSERKLLNKDYQVDPSEEDGHSSKLPLPVERTVATGVEDPDKEDGTDEYEDLHPVDPVQHIVQP